MPKKKFPILTTARCLLRDLTEKEVDAYLAIRSDESIMQSNGLSIYRPDDTERAKRFVRDARKKFERGRFICWGIFENDSEALLGTIYESIAEQHGRIEIGYFLARSGWGRGYMTEVLREVTRYNFAELLASRQQAWVFAGNPASVRVLEKCGFEYEGTLREYIRHADGTRRDVGMYSLIRPG